MQIVAEGVETPQQLELVMELQCEYVQGYELGGVISSAEATSLLASCQMEKDPQFAH